MSCSLRNKATDVKYTRLYASSTLDRTQKLYPRNAQTLATFTPRVSDLHRAWGSECKSLPEHQHLETAHTRGSLAQCPFNSISTSPRWPWTALHPLPSLGMLLLPKKDNNFRINVLVSQQLCDTNKTCWKWKIHFYLTPNNYFDWLFSLSWQVVLAMQIQGLVNFCAWMIHEVSVFEAEKNLQFFTEYSGTYLSFSITSL